MKLNAGLDPIIAILVGVGWFVVKALMNRREEADSWDDMERPAAPRPNLPPQSQSAPLPRIPQKNAAPLPPPVILTPQRKPTPPPIPARPTVPVVRTIAPPRPVIIAEPEGPANVELAKMRESRESYARAANLQRSVAQRLAAVDQQTSTHKAAQPYVRLRPAAAAHILRTFRNPTTVRQAFLASFVLNPPKSLE